MLRRQQKIKDPPSKTQLLKLLVPGYEQIIADVKSMTHRVTQEKMSRGDNNAGGAYAGYQAMANALREQAQAAAGGAGGA